MGQGQAPQQGKTVELTRRVSPVAAMTLVTIVAVGLALYSRRFVPEATPLSPSEFTTLRFEPFMLGVIVQAVVFPAALIYLFSSTQLFQRFVVAQPAGRDGLWLFVALSVIQLLTLGFQYGLQSLSGNRIPIYVSTGILVVVVGGLLNGWRTGLGLGIMTMLVRGSIEPISFFLEDLSLGLGFWFTLTAQPWAQYLLYSYLFHIWAMSPVYAGIIAGLGRELLGKHRYLPLAAGGLGAGIELLTGVITTLGFGPPGIDHVLPNMLGTGLAMTTIGLMIGRVQTDSVRRQAEAAELALAQAELRALRAQINPHFLFNALNTIRYFVRTDPETARRLLLDLSEVFQRVLRSGEMVSLEDELTYARAYLALEQARLNARLTVEWIREPGIDMEVTLPALTLQPIVENAILHGIAPKPEGGKLQIVVSQVENVLILQVRDDGMGMNPEQQETALGRNTLQTDRQSIGLRNVDERLRVLYGEAYGLRIDSTEGQGTHVQIRIPAEQSRRRGGVP